MKSKHLLNHFWMGLLIFFTLSCQKDELNEDNKENVPNTAEWTFSSYSYGYVTNGKNYVKNKKIEEGTMYVDLRVNVTKAGTYNFSTDTVNGYNFSGTGELVVKEEGAYQAIRLWASGTPVSSGTFEFEASFGESSTVFETHVVPFDATELESKIIVVGTYDTWNDRGDLTAYEAATGEVAWSVPNTDWITQADVNADTLYYSSYSSLEARNILTGELFWSVDKSAFNGMTYNQGVLYCSTNGGHVLAFKSSDGSLLRDFDLEVTHIISSIPVVADDVMFVGDEYLWAFNTDGSLKWKYTLPGYSRSGATVDNGVVYISTDNGDLFAVNISDGTLKWKYAVGTTGEECPTVSNGKVYSGSNNLYCLDAVSGQLIWQRDNINFEWDSPNVFNNTLYVAGDGVLYSINAETGETIWETSHTLSRISEIAAFENFITYYTAGLATRYAENGEIMWSNVDIYNNNFITSTLDPFIYDKVTQEVFLPSIYGSKK